MSPTRGSRLGVRVAAAGVGRRAAVLATFLAAVLVVTAAPASAVETHAFSASFGSAGSAAGEMLLQSSGNEIAGSGVAVSSTTHDVFVADTGNHRVDEFEANGTFVRAWGWEVNGVPGFGTCTLTCQAGSSGSAPGQFVTPVFIAVDNSGGSSAGDVYVGDAGSNLVSKFSAEGALVESWGVKGQLDGSTTTAGSFGSLAGVAVSATGALEVLDTTNSLFAFQQDGTFTPPELEFVRETQKDGLALDAAGNSFKVNGDGSVEQFSPSGGDIGQVSAGEEAEQHAQGTATDGSDLYIAEPGAVRHYLFSEPGRVTEPGGTACFYEPHAPCPASDSFGSSEPAGGSLTHASGVGVDASNGDVYVAEVAADQVAVFLPVVLPEVTTGAASEITPTSATLNGTVDPAGVQVTDCHFDYGTSTAYGLTVPCEQTVGSGTGEVAVTAKLKNLEPGVTYHYRLHATNSEGGESGEDETFATPPPPVITAETASNLTKETADLSVNVNPGGQETTCSFEYGTSTEYANPPLPCTPQPGKGSADVTVTQHIEKLAPDRLYHWRVVATNAAGTTTGVDHTFIYPTAGGGLPDGRAYEMVTPPFKNAALFGNTFGGLINIAVNGSRFILAATQCFGDAQSCQAARDGVGSGYAFSREAGSWVAHALAPPATQFEVSSVLSANADTGAALVSAPTPPHGEDDYYVRRLDGSMSDLGPVTPPELGAHGPKGNGIFATADLSHVVVMAGETGWPFQGADAGVFEYAGSGLSEPAPVGVSGGLGSTTLISFCATIVGSGNETAASSSALSADGETVFFTARRCHEPDAKGHPEVPVNEVYARLKQAETVRLSEGECGAGPAQNEVQCRAAPPADAEFQGASVDGTRALLTTPQQLTNTAAEDANATDNEEGKQCVAMVSSGCNLYEYDFSKPAGQRLVTVSAGDTSGGGPRVQGVVASSNDGSHVYFVARGVLSAAANGEGGKAKPGAPNLYLFERDAAHPAGVTTFIASLSDITKTSGLPDRELWHNGATRANVSSDGRFLVFYSQAPLTKDDTRPDGRGAQVFRYDAVTNGLVRVSVGQDGFNDNGNAGLGDAYIVRGRALTPFAGGSGRRDPTMSDDGQRVFFMSPVALTSGARNDVPIGSPSGKPEYAQNVYEWEQPGAGSCPSGRSSGCVFLISDGRDVSPVDSEICQQLSAVCLVGTDLSGSNVFFATADQLVPGDTDTQVDFYDARICTSGDPCIKGAPAPLPGCSGEACHGVPPATPLAPDAPSASFNGAGNITPPPTGGPPKPACSSSLGVPAKGCTRRQNLTKALAGCKRRFAHSRKKRAACVRQAHARYATRSRSSRSSSHGSRH